MKILIINTYDISGGAARAAYRLCKSLEAEGVDVHMLVQRKVSDDDCVISPYTKKDRMLALLHPTIDQLPVKIYKNRKKTLFSPGWISNGKVMRIIKEINPDIVHLHWINGGMIKIEDLKRIGKPIVWSLHDNWAFTGGCHIKWECDKYRSLCSECPVLASDQKRDLSYWVWKRKNKTYRALNNLTIVGLSNWITEESISSSLLGDKFHKTLPNPIDTNIYKPIEKDIARKLWGLPLDKKLILFGAMNAISDINKGFYQLVSALNHLNIESAELVVFGSSKPENPPCLPFNTHYIGKLHDDISLVTLYSAVDVMVVPSLQENLSNAVMESLSCAIPVVAFDVGGNGDMIEHQLNGYLAKPFEAKDLAKGIEWVLEHEGYDALCRHAREKVVREFDSRVVARKYIELYRECLRG